MVNSLRVDGVDISHHQDYAINFDVARRSGVKWMYHKATEGNTYRDDMYSVRRAQAKSADMPFGAYHFARPEIRDAVAEARWFMEVAKPRPGDLRPVLDLEDRETLSHMGMSATRRWAREFCVEVNRLLGTEPIVYTPFDLGPAFEGLLFWRPRYNNNNEPPILPWDIWQFSNGELGTPKRVSGLPGPTDLNIMRQGLTLAHLLIPEKRPVTMNTKRIKMIHASMQFSDNSRQQRDDARKVLGRNAHIITGTEAGPTSDLADILADEAPRYDYRLYKPPGGTDCWIAVKKTLIQGDWKQDYQGVIPGIARVYAGKGVVSVRFNNEDVGPISIAAAHYLTKGRLSGARRALNRRLAQAIGDWAKRNSKGKGLVFFGGDTNMVDRKDDVFFGEPMTTTWDEVKRWDNTGHGNIDVIASYDKDKRVKAISAKAFDDRELSLNTDHFLVESVFEVRMAG